MYCKTCGKELNDQAVFCPYCGCSVQPVAEKPVNKEEKVNVLSIVGFVLSLVSLLISLYGLVAIAGFVLSIIGYNQCKNKGEKLKGLAIAGIAISSASFVLTMILLMVGVSLLGYYV